MKLFRIVVAIMAMAVVTTAVAADERTPDVVAGDRLDLPSDEAMWYFTIAGTPGYAIEGPIVNQLKTNAHYRVIPEDDPIYDRYAPIIGKTPAVFVQRPDGFVVFKASGENFPATVADMEHDIQIAIRKMLPLGGRRDCPSCRPRPGPGPTPVPRPAPLINIAPLILPDTTPIDVVVDVVPEGEPDTKPEAEDGQSMIVLALAGLGGLLGGVVPDLMKGGE